MLTYKTYIPLCFVLKVNQMKRVLCDDNNSDRKANFSNQLQQMLYKLSFPCGSELDVLQTAFH